MNLPGAPGEQPVHQAIILRPEGPERAGTGGTGGASALQEPVWEGSPCPGWGGWMASNPQSLLQVSLTPGLPHRVGMTLRSTPTPAPLAIVWSRPRTRCSDAESFSSQRRRMRCDPGPHGDFQNALPRPTESPPLGLDGRLERPLRSGPGHLPRGPLDGTRVCMDNRPQPDGPCAGPAPSLHPNGPGHSCCLYRLLSMLGDGMDKRQCDEEPAPPADCPGQIAEGVRCVFRELSVLYIKPTARHVVQV